MIIRPTNSPVSLVFSPASDARLPVIGWHTIAIPSADNLDATSASLPVANLSNPSTHLYWGGEITDDTITCWNDNAETLNYLALAQHNFGSGGFSLTLYGATTSSPSDRYEIVQQTSPTDDSPIIFQFADQAPRNLQLRIEAANPGDFAVCAVMYVGRLTQLERSLRVDMNHTPINLGTVSAITSGTSESGQFVGRMVRNQYKETKADFWYFNNDFYRADFDSFVRNAVDNPFFFAWAPEDYPSDVDYCWLTKDPTPEFHLPTERFIVSLEMRGIA